jgi:hypothetical protein
MKFIEPRPLADPDAAARKLVEIASGIDAVQDGRVYINKVAPQTASNCSLQVGV